MKILFLHHQEFIFFSVAALSGYLKKNSNHTACVLIESIEKNIFNEIKEIKPEIIGFSILSNDYQWFKKFVKKIKTNFPDIPIIVGGVHSLIHTQLIENPYIDMTCNGDGEEVLLQLLNNMEKGIDYSSVAGLNVKKNGQIFYNGVAAPVQNLDSYMEDREIYYERYPQFKDDSVIQIMSSRGCPYKCTFCMNERYNELFKGKGKIYRKKSVQRIIDEIYKVYKFQKNASTLYFVDDLFLLEKQRFIEIAYRIKKEFNIKFMSLGMAESIDEEIASVMKDTNFITYITGFETANEKHRKEIFKKNNSNETFVKMAEILHKYGIKVYTSNLFAYPEQTIQDIFDTIEFNINIKADYTFASILIPYPGSPIEIIAKEKGLLPTDWGFDKIPKSYFEEIILNMPDRLRILKLFRLFYFLTKYPDFFYFVRKFKFIIKYIPFTKYICYLGIFLWFKNWRELGYIECFKYFWRFRKNH